MSKGENMVERCARAIWDVSQIGGANAEEPRFEEIGKNALCYRQARAVIEALMTPTPEMLQATNDILSHFDGEYGDVNVYVEEDLAEKIFQAMLRTILSQPNEEGEARD